MTTTRDTTDSATSSPEPSAGQLVRERQSRRRQLRARIAVHGILVGYTLVALAPIAMIVMNSLKERAAIFDSPFAPPTPETFSGDGYESVFNRADFVTYFANSITVTVASVVLTVLFAAMAAFALTEYRVKIAPFLLAYLALGIMVPIRLGTVSILQLMNQLGLVNTRTALVLVYVAMGLPLAVVLLTQFFRQAPTELREAARVDGASEYRVFAILLPIVRPGLAAVAVASMLPIWNDLWFPLILAPSDATSTVTLAVQQFIGQFSADWNAVLATLTLGALPLILLYLVFARQFVRGLTAGVGK
ncbi:carbohydrate ABC transporter permease [Egibacter rhizosphaerae]|uniref:Carbohydrate ABC transporter permease n=1 Tax=Egibacter rhizosphaerae TaxID=1670831 RepID=A0A411YE95_9ACTN|nr:carbohydrate ABC transporter permease [Egibacter rhizosphaerae]QBI19528.1 carbohydrate ABC transporter permease [Egibacter rhizosphaerae]